MATKKTSKKTAKKAPVKKAAAKKASAKKTAAKKPVAKKASPAKGAQFHLYDEGQKKFVPAEQAKAVKIDGFDAFSFFLHKSADGKGWTISEASSGGRIAVGFTQKEAKGKTIEALGKHGEADLAESIRRTIAKNGAAPGHEAEAKKAPKVTTRLKSRILAALVDDKKLPCEQVHFDEIAASTGADVGDVAATLMVLELDRAVKSLPGKLYRLAKAEEQKSSGNRGRKPNGIQCLGSQNRARTREDDDAGSSAPRRVNARRGSRPSQLDAAVEILKDAKEPLTCKEIVRRMFERKIWETSGRTPGATLSASMQREIAKRGAQTRFRKAERGLYALNA
jgi:hypothetical protein